MRLLLLLVASAAIASPPRARMLIVTVRDAAGPVAGATVTRTYQLRGLPSLEATAHTDAHGRATLSGLARREELRIEAAGHVTRELVFTRDDLAASMRTVTLVAGAPIEGISLDAHGKPAAAFMQLAIDGDTVLSTRSDPDGRWWFEMVPAGHHWVNGRPIDSDGIHAASMVVQAPPVATISGVVIDQTGRAVAGARVSNASDAVVTDAAGRFSLDNFTGGRCEVYAVTATSASRVAVVEVAANEHASIELVLAESSLAGSIVDARGRPVRTHLSAVLPGTTVQLDADSDADGGFAFGAPAGEYWIRTSVEHGQDASAQVHAGDHHVELVIPEGGTVVGRVRFRGTTISAFGVDVSGIFPAPEYGRDGRFAQRGVRPGPVDVKIVAAGFMPRHFAFTVAPGATIDLGDIELRRGRTLRGRVIDEHGFAVAHAIVRFSSDGNFDDDPRDLFALMHGHLGTETDADGNFVIRGADPAQVGLLEARAGDRRSRQRPSDEDLLIVEPTGGIAGNVVLRTSDQREISAGPYTAMIMEDGGFRFAHLPPGEYTLELAARSAERVTVVAGEDTRVEIAAPRDPVLLTVATPCFSVTLKVADEARARALCSLGLAELPAVSAGRYMLCINDDGPCDLVELPGEPLHQQIDLP